MAGSDGLFGSSAEIHELRRYLGKLARSDATVLVTGETGTGKERVASAVHRLGRRAAGPFVAVNCAAIPETMIESELFGHERGAFTGAHSAFAGRFAQADKGTLFLDEISEMTLAGQAKLLRVLEDRCIHPIGGVRPRPVDVRVVAASNECLEELVERRAFRADLFYRLNVARIELPPLRERPEDIAPIVAHFIDDQNRRQALRVGRPDSALLDLMRRYRWPGNVRELRNMVEAVFVDPPRGGALRLDDLPPAYRRLFAGKRMPQEPERERLIAVLRDTNWNKVEAARQMNWSRMTLYRRLAKYDLTAPEPAA
ncbi:sigma-54-dependent Fis family transcriptional regulator [Sphingosinicella sp. BN140058]|uniref:sigma-54 interaction domain-containing protein n=1 Tax=Sphingosinicella sp. BN140058 TaxID=1892855 RepID=UPI0010131FA8|nr:sigma 54-interacting transcriptional regulator [Sphingosinicella sp. BN140058]QAY75970.1 AAA family ATPase [Sphingosinicella sp. BN140058]